MVEQLFQEFDQHVRVRATAQSFDVDEDHGPTAVRATGGHAMQKCGLADAAPTVDELMSACRDFLKNPRPRRHEPGCRILRRALGLGKRGEETCHVFVTDPALAVRSFRQADR